MTDLILARTSAAAEAPTLATAAPALITEEQVRFATAAAVAPAKYRRWTAAMVAVRGWFAAPQPTARNDYPRRYAYLENALMSREMYRL